jgi:hypothetical protein
MIKQGGDSSYKELTFRFLGLARIPVLALTGLGIYTDNDAYVRMSVGLLMGILIAHNLFLSRMYADVCNDKHNSERSLKIYMDKINSDSNKL